jgi:hypothetical protein
MQQMFQCYRCGSQNYMGQPYCWNCQSPFQYNCPDCNATVQNANTPDIKQEKKGLRIGAIIVGIIGSLAGILVAALILFIAGAVTIIGGIADSIQGTTETRELQATGFPIALRSLFVLLISLIGITGASLSLAKPRLGGVLMIITGIGGFFLASWLWLFSGVLLIIASIMALCNWLREKIGGTSRSGYARNNEI